MHCKFIIPQGSQPKQAIPLVLPSTQKPSSPCGCGCSEVKAVPSGNSTHYARWNCCNCERFRGWVPKPTNLTATQAEDELIDRLLACGRLNDWEIGFCRSLKGQKKRSPRQKEKLQEIAKRLRLNGQEQIAWGDGSTQQPRTRLLGWKEIKLKRPCACGCEYAWAVPRPDTIHHAALHCQHCDRFNGWQPKPQAQGGAR